MSGENQALESFSLHESFPSRGKNTGLQAGQWKIHQLINLVLTQSLHPLQAQGFQTFKSPIHLKTKNAQPLKKPTSVHRWEFKCSSRQC